MDYKALTEQLVTRCMDKGADAAEVYLETERSLNIRVRNGEVELVQESTSNGVGFRIFVQGKMAFAHCNNLSDASLNTAIASAIEYAAHMTADENNILPGELNMTEIEGLYDPQIGSLSMDSKIELVKKAEELALSDSRITKSGGASYSDGEGEIYLVNSNGISKNYKSTGFGYSVYVVAEKGGEKSSGGDGSRKRFYADLEPAGEIAKSAAEKAYEMLDPRIIKTQRAPVIFDPDVSRSLLGGIIGAVNGERVLQGASFLRDKLGEKIAVTGLTLIDDGIRPKALSSSPFDGEGVPTQRRNIVDKGVLQGFMYNTITAKRAGAESTGNASRRGFASVPGIGPHHFYMENGRASQRSIIRNTKKGLYLKGVTGYGINPVSGNFSGGARGFWIENGAIAYPVKDLTIAATADAMLNGIDMIGNDLDLVRGRSAPTFRIHEMQIGGE